MPSLDEADVVVDGDVPLSLPNLSGRQFGWLRDLRQIP